ncbi:hypothetical protein [Limosilactobacillus agrestimuris]|uniref:hypothetical protein n=1 Tax=Limosilactobacillus agrestimuris TaxID=2941331 RepID=UPI00203FBEF1|nr:hypothetical protein [Limosilactobacillus agrestimuris]
MREIPIKQAHAILKRFLKGNGTQQIQLLTKKKDRSLSVKTNNDELTLIEQGYVNKVTNYSLNNGEAKHGLMTAFKREFPRSHQLYLNQRG